MIPAVPAARPLVGRAFTAAAALQRAGGVRAEAVGDAEQAALRAKFELAPPEVMLDHDRARTIPWGYGRNRVTAMAVDPERLFAYWEVTDEGIATAREALGSRGDGAGLTLRIHDVTGLLFDGSNANHSFDLALARSDRQWFVAIGRPTSTVIVEVGLRAQDGGFVKIARSKRVDFPRRAPAPPAPAEWLTVRVAATPGGQTDWHVEPAAAADRGRAPFGDDDGAGDGLADGASFDGPEGRAGRRSRPAGGTRDRRGRSVAEARLEGDAAGEVDPASGASERRLREQQTSATPGEGSEARLALFPDPPPDRPVSAGS